MFRCMLALTVVLAAASTATAFFRPLAKLRERAVERGRVGILMPLRSAAGSGCQGVSVRAASTGCHGTTTTTMSVGCHGSYNALPPQAPAAFVMPQRSP